MPSHWCPSQRFGPERGHDGAGSGPRIFASTTEVAAIISHADRVLHPADGHKRRASRRSFQGEEGKRRRNVPPLTRQMFGFVAHRGAPPFRRSAMDRPGRLHSSSHVVTSAKSNRT